MKLIIAGVRHLRVGTLLLSLLEAFGVLWLIVQIVTFFSTTLSTSIKSYWWLFGVLGLVAGIIRAWPKLSISALVPGTDCTITIRVCDMFRDKKTALIIGTNCTFDTAMDDETISAESVQGQFTKNCCTSVHQLDRDISHSLHGITSTRLDGAQKPYGKLEMYEIGTVASVNANMRRAYLVAIARMNEHHVAQATLRDVMDALPNLWENIRNRGGLHVLCSPVLGTGFSRLDATREKVVIEMIRSFIPAIKNGNFCKGLILAISPDDYSKRRIDLKRLGEFLRLECEYGAAEMRSANRNPTGSAV